MANGEIAMSQSIDSHRSLVRRRDSTQRRSDNDDAAASAMYQPGMPIGYLAARGTPYERKYLTRKVGACCLFCVPPVMLIVGVIGLLPVLYALALHALRTSQLHIYSANITNLSNTTVDIAIAGQAKKTGIFPAKLYFRAPVDVYWTTPPPELREVHLGRLQLAPLGVAAGHAMIKQISKMAIVDEQAFGEFAKFLVSKPNFTWRFVCTAVHAEGLGFFPIYRPFRFEKHVVINGLDNFHDIKIRDLQLPGDDPQGGVQIIATSTLVNPSPFGVQVGSLVMALSYKGLYLGPVSIDNLTVTAGINTLTLKGSLLSQATNQTALTLLGELFTRYINSDVSDVEISVLSTQQANGDVVSWLSTGLQALQAHVAFLPPSPLDPIKGLQLNYVSLVYKKELPYNPDLFSNDLVGKLVLPFGFSFSVTDLSAAITIVHAGAEVATAYSPYGNATSDVYLQTQLQTAADIRIAFPPTQLILPNTTDAAKRQLILFQNELIYNTDANFTAVGAAKTVLDTPLGRLLLDGVRFNVVTGLAGLDGLQRYPTIINSVDVIGGTSDAVSLVVGTTVVNPSNLNLSAGDFTFELLNQVPLGNITLPGLNLKPGRNEINATGFFDPNRSPYGLEALNRFISGVDTMLNVTGTNRSSEIVSLAPSLAGLRLNATLPGLEQRIVFTANLTILDTTGVLDDIAHAHVAANNPFTADLTITRIRASASSHGIFLANIDTEIVFPAAGHALTTSPVVPLSLNLYPPDIFGLVRALAIQSRQDPAYIDGVVQLGGFTLSPTSEQNADEAVLTTTRRAAEEEEEEEEVEDRLSQMLLTGQGNPGMLLAVGMYKDKDELAEQTDGRAKRALPLPFDRLQKRDNLYTNFDLTQYVARAFTVARADMTIEADTRIGGYGTTLTFMQTEVPLGTDVTLFKLLPVLARPIVQRIVDGAVLNVDRVTILEARPTSFTASLQGALTNAGPFDGVVSFPSGVTIYWQGQALAQAVFPNVSLVGDLGAVLNVQVEGVINDVPFFTRFLEYAVLNPAFEWNIRAENLTVAAVGVEIGGVTINKNIQLTGLNGLRGQVILNSFDVPSNDPDGGLHLTALATINNPAQVGVALKRFGTNIFSGNSHIGPAASDGFFVLQALAVTQVPLVGRIQRQDSEQGLADLSEVITRFVHNQNSQLRIKGAYAGDPDVAWLNDGIKVLSLDVILPSQKFDVIRLVSINQLSLAFTVPTAYTPVADSSDTSANFFLPFAFPIAITAVQGPFTLRYQDVDMAVLQVPSTARAQTDVEARILHIAFTRVPLAVSGAAHGVFSDFVADVTREQQVTFNLHGAATGTADTAAGVLTVRDLPFDLDTNLLGLQNLNARPASVANLDVFRGHPTYLDVRLDTTLYNPSDVSISAGDVSFATLFTDHIIGQAVINDIHLVPGVNVIPTQLNYAPVGAANVQAGQTLLENYVQNITSAAAVAGTSETTPIESLKQGLGQISVNAAIPPLGKLIVVQAALSVPKDIAQNGGQAMANVLVANPFTASINILRLNAKANFQDISVGTIDVDLEKNIIHAAGKQTTQTQQIPLTIDLDPKNLIRFIEAAAAQYGVSLGPLPPFFQRVLDLSDTSTAVSPYPDDTPIGVCDSGTAFDVLGAVRALLAPLALSLPIEAVLKIDEYQTALNFLQQPVPTKTDETALYLVGPPAAPLIQLVVNEAGLRVDRANATRLTNAGFQATIMGALNVNSPADAVVEFPDPLSIIWQGVEIANLALPDICITNGIGAPNLLTTAQLTIVNEDAFERFSLFLLQQPSFEWTLRSETVVARALGIKFSNVLLEKTITINAFNGLPGLRITAFDAPGDTADTIDIVTTASIPSQAALGVELGAATFDLYFQGVRLGSATSSNLFLPYKSTVSAVLHGSLVSQKGNSAGIDALGVLFTQYLSEVDTTLQIRGNNVVGPYSGGEPIRWLSNAFRRFTTDVVLPGKRYQIIKSITLSDLSATVPFPGRGDYHYQVSNNATTAVFANPFGFALTPRQIGPALTVNYAGMDAAQLNLPLAAPVTTATSRGEDESLVINFIDQDLYSLNDAAFRTFVAALADTETVTFAVNGVATVVAELAIGTPTITGVGFNVTTALMGINSFGHTASAADVTVDDPTDEYIGIHLTAILDNPAPISLNTDRALLPVIYNNGQLNPYLGRAYIATLGIIPGENRIAVLFQFVLPANGTAESMQVHTVLQRYLETTNLLPDGPTHRIPLRIDGKASSDPPLSPYPSLEQGLEGVTADMTLDGLGIPIVLRADVYIPPSALLTGLAGILGSVLGSNLVADLLKGLLGAGGGGSTSQSDEDSAGVGTFLFATVNAQNAVPTDLRIVRLLGQVYDATDNYYMGIFDTFARQKDLSFSLPKAASTGMPDGTHLSPILRYIRLVPNLLEALGHLHNLSLRLQIALYVAGPGGQYLIPSLNYNQNNIETHFYIAIAEDSTAGAIEITGLGSVTDLITKLTENTALGNTVLQPLLDALGLLNGNSSGGAVASTAKLQSLGVDVVGRLCILFRLSNCPTAAATSTASSTSAATTPSSAATPSARPTPTPATVAASTATSTNASASVSPPAAAQPAGASSPVRRSQ